MYGKSVSNFTQRMLKKLSLQPKEMAEQRQTNGCRKLLSGRPFSFQKTTSKTSQCVWGCTDGYR